LFSSDTIMLNACITYIKIFGPKKIIWLSYILFIVIKMIKNIGLLQSSQGIFKTDSCWFCESKMVSWHKKKETNGWCIYVRLQNINKANTKSWNWWRAHLLFVVLHDECIDGIHETNIMKIESLKVFQFYEVESVSLSCILPHWKCNHLLHYQYLVV